MDKKYLFDEVVLDYEKRRPRYGERLFEDVIKYASLNNEKSIVEIGCGTGQATEPFLKAKCKVTAVELGENLAAYTREKFKNYTNFEVVHSSFEAYECDDNKFDMLYSATAFHWIQDEIGYSKAYRILKNRGTIALFWNRPSVNTDNPLHEKIQSLYRQFLPQWNNEITNDDESRYKGIINKIKYYGFTNVDFHLYHNTRRMTGIEYIELLNTYSDHRAIDKSIQIPFFNAIRTAIEDSGNELIINDTVDLYLGRKG